MLAAGTCVHVEALAVDEEFGQIAERAPTASLVELSGAEKLKLGVAAHARCGRQATRCGQRRQNETRISVIRLVKAEGLQ
jgi:hypothetical protein